jgi:transcription elongation factor Elf1
MDHLVFDNSDCYFHAHEKAEASDYLQCYECGHSYKTAQNLIDELKKLRGPEDNREIVLEKIFFCPICLHDF